MAEARTSSRIWAMRGLYLMLAVVILLFQLVPLDTQPQHVAGPDLLLALTFGWALRRPDYVPVLLVASIWLMADLLLQRPPGLWSALVVLATEWLRDRGRQLRDAPISVELAAAAAALAAITFLHRLILSTLVLPVPGWRLTLSQLAFTIIAIPLVLILSRFLLGMHRAAPGEVDAMGHKL